MTFKPQHILVPVAAGQSDDILLAEHLVTDAAAVMPPNGKMTLLYVVPPPAVYAAMDTGFAPPTFYSMVADIAEQNRACAVTNLASLKKRAEALGLNVTTMVAEPVEGTGEVIAIIARDVGADLIAVCSHGRRGIRRLFLGSVAERVAHVATVPVLILRAPPIA